MMEWFFPDRLFVLPQNCTTFGQSIEAPRKKYIRADVARAEAEAMVRAEREALAEAATEAIWAEVHDSEQEQWRLRKEHIRAAIDKAAAIRARGE